MKALIISSTLLLLAACSSVSVYEQTVDDYVMAAANIELGMTRQRVLEVLSPSQRRLSNIETKQADKYVKDGVNVEILYFRSGWQSDGFTTSDEYTPYILNDGKLVAIGWASLRDAKWQVQAGSSTHAPWSNDAVVYSQRMATRSFGLVI